MKHIKAYNEKYISPKLEIVKCNWCNWFGEEDDLLMRNDGECPNCQEGDYLMSIKFDDDFYEYVKNHEPEPNIDKKDDYDNYKGPYDYYKALYPLYFNSKKYNL